MHLGEIEGILPLRSSAHRRIHSGQDDSLDIFIVYRSRLRLFFKGLRRASIVYRLIVNRLPSQRSVPGAGFQVFR
jgi:hypothetical protein